MSCIIYKVHVINVIWLRLVSCHVLSWLIVINYLVHHSWTWDSHLYAFSVSGFLACNIYVTKWDIVRDLKFDCWLMWECGWSALNFWHKNFFTRCLTPITLLNMLNYLGIYKILYRTCLWHIHVERIQSTCFHQF